MRNVRIIGLRRGEQKLIQAKKLPPVEIEMGTSSFPV